MRVALSDEQKMFKHTIQRIFEKECPPSLIRKLQGSKDPAQPAGLWNALRQSGVFSLALPTDDVEQGSSTLFELGLVYEEGGRVLCPTFVYSTIEFAIAVSRLPISAREREDLVAAAAGDVVGTIALSDPSDGSNVAPLISARRQGRSWILSGSLDFVPNADFAEALLTTARVADSWGRSADVTVVVPREKINVRRRSTFARDNQCLVSFDDVQVKEEDIFTGGNALTDEDLRWIANVNTALHCMDMVGGAQAVIDQTVEYIKQRHQFGRPIASFQAAQHHIANMHIAVEGARLAAYQAVFLVGTGVPADRETAIAKLKANEAYKLATLTAHQLQGGMGYVVDTDLHLWSERAKAMELRDGAWDTQIRRLTVALGFQA